MGGTTDGREHGLRYGLEVNHSLHGEIILARPHHILHNQAPASKKDTRNQATDPTSWHAWELNTSPDYGVASPSHPNADDAVSILTHPWSRNRESK